MFLRRVVTVLMWLHMLAFWLIGMYLIWTPWDYKLTDRCPDGRVYTEWCGCQPPSYGTDC